MRPLSLLVPLVGLLCALSTACEPPEQPGERVGLFQVTGSLDANACGAAVPALDPIGFAVELRDEFGRALWVMDEQPLQTGIRLPDGAYRFRSGTTVPVLAPQIDYRGCSLQQVEFVEVRISVAEGETADAEPAETVTLDGDAGIAADVDLEITGFSEIQFTPTSDSDCSPLPVVNGGPWAALPCTVTYSLFGAGSGPAPMADDAAP